MARNNELQKRLLFVIAMVIVYRLGVHVPVPGVDASAVTTFFQDKSSTLFGLFNTFSGGALKRFSVFALGIMPYISSSIIFQLLTTAVPYLEALKKEGEAGRKKITQLTRYGTVVLAVIQGLGIASWLENQVIDGRAIVTSAAVGILSFKVMTVLSLTAGTCFVMWLGEQITERGIGNGSSIIIFTGIVADIPSAAVSLMEQVKTGNIAGALAFILILFMIGIIGLIIFLEVGQRRIPIQYSGRTAGPAMNAAMSHLPLKINFSGVIPPIFASSLLMFPATMAQFIDNPWLRKIQESVGPGGTIYNILFVALIVFFCFFYTEIVFNPNDVAENLKKYGGFIPGVRAGKSTADYIQKVIERINVGGAIYLSVLCVLPTLLVNQMKVPFYFGGTGLLIVVGVALDTSQQIQSYLLTSKYEGLVKNVKIRSRRVQF
ncbi:MAG: preprotein translocase subunit SecY [Proteobacteria bacterium SG_bin7]|nr:MAG: preprotein translocase subunit SecY [Proteobacteria bacterium SG_bin7]